MKENTARQRGGLAPAVTYLEPTELDAMRALARNGDRSLAAELRRAVRAYLEATVKA